MRHFLASVVCGIALAGGGVAQATDPSCPEDVFPAPVGDGVVDSADLAFIFEHWETGYCFADIAPNGGDGIVGEADLQAVYSAWGACPTTGIGACMTSLGVCEPMSKAECVEAAGLGWAPGDCSDEDVPGDPPIGDGIPDVFEVANCRQRCGAFVGTLPTNADTDGDSLSDFAETFGVNGLDLPLLGANPLRKTIFLEIDWEEDNGHSHRPTPESIGLFVAAFEGAPVDNPCGPTGIDLIVDYGQGGVYVGGQNIGEYGIVTFAETSYYAIKHEAENFANERNGYFHYSIHCHSNGGAAGLAESVPGDDHIVSLSSDVPDFFRALVVMHELGHCLGLYHGGGDGWNFKPNYNSIMNYLRGQGADGNCDGISDGILDYSHGSNPPLDETELYETIDLCGNVATSFFIDWNGNNVPDIYPVAGNVHCGFFPFGVACDTSWCPGNGACIVLYDYNDWDILTYSGILDPTDAGGQTVECDFELP